MTGVRYLIVSIVLVVNDGRRGIFILFLSVKKLKYNSYYEKDMDFFSLINELKGKSHLIVFHSMEY